MRKLIPFLFLAIFMLSACLGTTPKSAKTAILTQKSIVDLATKVDAMCSAGILTQPQCDEVGQLYDQAKTAYGDVLAAELALIDAAVVGKSTTREEAALTTMLQTWTPLAAQIITLAAKYGIIEEE